MLVQITTLAFVLGVASAGVVLGGVGGLGGVGLVGTEHGVVDLHTPPRYEFKYGIADPKTGDRKQQSEVRVNDVVKGEYSLVEPDGTVRVVKYTADDHNGFNAIVSRVGHAVHPQVLVRKAVVPVAHAIPVAHAVPVAAHGIAIGGIGLGGLEGGLLGGHGGLIGGELVDHRGLEGTILG